MIPPSGSKLKTLHAIAAATRQVDVQNFESAFSPIVLAGVVRMIEAALVAIVGFCLYLWYASAFGDFARYGTNIAGTSLLSLFAFQFAGIYQLRAFRGYEKPYVRLTVAWSLVFLLAIAVLYFTRSSTDVSRTWLASYYLVGLLVLIAFRYILFLLVRGWTRQGRFDRRTVIIGSGDDGKALIAQLVARQDSDVRIIGMFDDRGDDRSASACYGIPKLGKVDDLVEFARHTRVDLVIVALPITAEERVLQMLKKLWVLPLDIRLAAHNNKLRFRPRSYSYIADVPVFDISDRPIADWNVVIKWLFDKVVGMVALVCAAPLMLAIALAIKLDSRGPVLFRQRRYGFNNEIVDVYKFRSMYVEHADVTASKLVTRNDPRVT